MKILFASSNAHKIQEIKELLPKSIELLSLSDIDFYEEIPETADTIEGNAIQKATFLAERLNMPCFADDTGLIIPSLNGEPGVYSARYAGPQRNSEENMDLVLQKLISVTSREAHFKTVIALWINQKTILFEGKIEGEICTKKRGENGFGYDPIFIPKGSEKTFAEMNSVEKNSMSHRGKAVSLLVEYLIEVDRFKFKSA